MTRLVAILVAFALALAGCTNTKSGSSNTASPSAGRPGAASPSTSKWPVLTCPKVASGVPALRVVGREVTLRERMGRLRDGTPVYGEIPNGQVVELLSVERGPWRKVRCGKLTGFALAYEDQSGANRRHWLEPVS